MGNLQVEQEAAAPTASRAVPTALHLANPLMTGDDVRHAQELLTESRYGNFHPGAVDGEYGPATAGATERAKWALGFPTGKCDNVFGETIRGMLEGTTELPPDYRARLEARAHETTRDATIRTKIVQYAQWGCENEASIHYDHLRPIDGLGKPKKLPLRTDCSGFATDCYDWAGAPDPNGRDYCGAGWTGDMIQTGKRIPLSAARPGDLVVYGGPPSRQHVCIVIKGGPDPLLVSHGQEKGPFRVSFTDETAAHQGQPVYWLSFLH